MPPSLTKKVGLAALIMMASVLLSRVIGLRRNIERIESLEVFISM